ncbi:MULTISPECIES: cupin domain-containing protein [unclassified Robiginitalea]|uniref:cupin domain-containing protein n=1 Tax=Robiginitalea TaxID=252306 RepID=UPI0023490F8E|nr:MULTISPECIES: cupin domain-containing protein [unclassified Robiginitalea]MDC6355095.1 cupin domain-containing protein [Robiginitalea sp. PM2]MDC6375690.1 cupin domain-containing protein [Robiginitalea sp. SP8]
MERRKFILASAMSTSAFMLNAQNVSLNHNQRPFIIKAGDGRKEGFTLQNGLLKVSGQDTLGQFSLFEMKNEDGPKAGPPLHVHKYQDEVFQIIEGEFLFQVGDNTIEAQKGDIVFGPRNIPHTFFQKSKKGHMFFSYNPAGKMENILKAVNELIPNHPKKFAEVCAENDVPFVGPPMTGE